MSKMTFYTDRSRIDLHHRCPQARYLAYHWGGTGIRKDKVVWDIVIGLCVHEGLSELLNACRLDELAGSPVNHESGRFPSYVNTAVKIALERLDLELSSTPFDLSEITTESLDPAPTNLFLPEPGKESVDHYLSYLIDETKALIELLIRSYAYAPAGLKWLLETYEILEVEQEDEFTLIDKDDFEVKFMARADGLLRRRIDGALVVLSFKTTKIYESYKEGAAASDMQGMSEVVAIEKRLEEWGKKLSDAAYQALQNPQVDAAKQVSSLSGVPEWFARHTVYQIEGVQMIYFLTSDQRKNKGDIGKRRTSGLLRPWIKHGGGMLPDEFSFASDWVDGEGKNRRLGKDWSRVNSWELDGGIAGYVEMIKDAWDDSLGGYPLDQIIVNSTLHRREKDKLERWERETRAQETLVAGGLLGLHNWQESIEAGVDCLDKIEEIKDVVFPHHNNACYDFKKPCQFWELCWGNRLYAEDPLGSGYKRREPHHPLEMEGLVQIEKKEE